MIFYVIVIQVMFTCMPAEQGLCADSLLSLRDPDHKSSGPPSLFEKFLQNSFFYVLMNAGDKNSKHFDKSV